MKGKAGVVAAYGMISSDVMVPLYSFPYLGGCLQPRPGETPGNVCYSSASSDACEVDMIRTHIGDVHAKREDNYDQGITIGRRVKQLRCYNLLPLRRLGRDR